MFSKRIFMLLVKQISLKLFLRIAHENTVSSELFNRDADMASEIGKFTSNQIMVEASTVIRAQAIKSSLDILKLLLRVSLALFPKRTFFTENLQERLSYNWVLDLYLINIGAGQSRYKKSTGNQQAVSI
jgi:hypothetical protein